MERLTLENAINRSRKLAERHRWNSENTRLETSDKNANEVYKNNCIKYANQEEQYAEWLEELKSYKDIGTLKELKELKENGTFTGLELTKLAIMQKELKKYEDLEEQGLIVRLPCKVGDDLYCIVNGEVKKLKVHSFGVPDFEITDIEFKYVDGFKIVRFVGEVGKTVFLTREEAEKKLDEMKNEI